jgi:hypothetical protein
MTLPIKVSPYGWGYYLLDLPAATWAWELYITAPGSSCPGYYLGYNRLSSEVDYDAYSICLEDDSTTLGFACDAACAASNAKSIVAGGVWVLAATAYYNTQVDAGALLRCFPPPPPPPSAWKQALQLRLGVSMTAAQFNANVQDRFRRALALAAAVNPEQVSLTVVTVSGAAAGSRRRGASAEPELDEPPSARLPARRLLEAVGQVLVDVVVGGLADASAVSTMAQRLTLAAINAQMTGQGLPAVQVCDRMSCLGPLLGNSLAARRLHVTGPKRSIKCLPWGIGSVAYHSTDGCP